MGKREDGENSLTEFWIYRHTLRYLKWITNKVLLDSARKSAQYIYILLSPFTVHHHIVNQLYSNIKLKVF